MLSILVNLFLLYLLLGLIFALFFVFRGVQQMDEGADGAPWTFRLLLLPGAAALWIVLLPKWLKKRRK